MLLDLTDGKSILVHVMVWCRQATNHYLSQCWSRSLSPYGVTRHSGLKCHLNTASLCRLVINCLWTLTPICKPLSYVCSAQAFSYEQLPGMNSINQVPRCSCFFLIAAKHGGLIIVMLTHWPLGVMVEILDITNSLYRIVAWVFTVKLLSGKCHRTSLMRSQYWFR